MQQHILKMSSMFSGWEFYMKMYSFMYVENLGHEFYKEHLPGYVVKKPLSPLALESSSCICTAAHIKSDLVWKFDTLKLFVCSFLYTLSLDTPYIFKTNLCLNAVFIYKLLCRKSNIA